MQEMAAPKIWHQMLIHNLEVKGSLENYWQGSFPSSSTLSDIYKINIFHLEYPFSYMVNWQEKKSQKEG